MISPVESSNRVSLLSFSDMQAKSGKRRSAGSTAGTCVNAEIVGPECSRPADGSGPVTARLAARHRGHVTWPEISHRWMHAAQKL
mmetsp:Transcript_103488/g.179695  ORF Transcript_103488/g.179695 Transcript_103488/m.179695 type:complete len:85 (-) Transcript_103488:205-459(-)